MAQTTYWGPILGRQILLAGLKTNGTNRVIRNAGIYIIVVEVYTFNYNIKVEVNKKELTFL